MPTKKVVQLTSGALLLSLAPFVHAKPRLNVDGRYTTHTPNLHISDCNKWPSVCPGTVPSKMTPTWKMNASTIIMPCNNTGWTDPESTKGWGIVDFDWSNSKGTGSSEGWAKHQPMDDEELLFKQVQITTSALPSDADYKQTVWVYRCSVYGYPWYTSVRELLEDPQFLNGTHPWFMKFKKEGPWFSDKCDAFKKDVCSDLYHSQEQSPGYPHGDGDCALPGCDCGEKVPCGFYVFNHSSTVKIDGKTFQDWFVNDYMLNYMDKAKYGDLGDKISGMFWDDVWNPICNIHDQVPHTCDDMGLVVNSPEMVKLTEDYQANMAALRDKTLSYGKFSWQMLWTGEGPTDIGNTCPHPIVSRGGSESIKEQKEEGKGAIEIPPAVDSNACAARLRELCQPDSPPQNRAMMYQLSTGRGGVRDLFDLKQDLANFLLIRGEYAWLGHGWKGCSQEYLFPDEFNVDYGEPLDDASAAGKKQICKETSDGSGIFTREYTKSSIKMDCNKWQGTITMKSTDAQKTEAVIVL